MRKRRKATLINKHTDWEVFGKELDRLINLKVRLKTSDELDTQVQNIVNYTHSHKELNTNPYGHYYSA